MKKSKWIVMRKFIGRLRHLWHYRIIFRCLEDLYWQCIEEKYCYDESIGELSYVQFILSYQRHEQWRRYWHVIHARYMCLLCVLHHVKQLQINPIFILLKNVLKRVRCEYSRWDDITMMQSSLDSRKIDSLITSANKHFH